MAASIDNWGEEYYSDDDIEEVAKDVYDSLGKMEEEIARPDFSFEREKYLKEIKRLKQKLLKIF